MEEPYRTKKSSDRNFGIGEINTSVHHLYALIKTEKKKLKAAKKKLVKQKIEKKKILNSIKKTFDTTTDPYIAEREFFHYFGNYDIKDTGFEAMRNIGIVPISSFSPIHTLKNKARVRKINKQIHRTTKLIERIQQAIAKFKASIKRLKDYIATLEYGYLNQ